MRYYDEYLELYSSDDDWYGEFVERELKKLQRRSDKNESKAITRRNK